MLFRYYPARRMFQEGLLVWRCTFTAPLNSPRSRSSPHQMYTGGWGPRPNVNYSLRPPLIFRGQKVRNLAAIVYPTRL